MSVTEPSSGSSSRPTGKVLALGASACALVGALGWWSLRPLPEIESQHAQTVESTASGSKRSASVALDELAFRAPLWIAPPAPPAPPAKAESKPEPAPPPLKLQILAIAHEDGAERALLYDPDTDKPVWVSAGQSLGQRRVEKVTAGAVEIRDGKHLRTLALRESRGADSPLERALRGTASPARPVSVKGVGVP